MKSPKRKARSKPKAGDGIELANELDRFADHLRKVEGRIILAEVCERAAIYIRMKGK